MNPFLRNVALWILGWLQAKVDPDLAKKLGEYRTAAKKFDAELVSAKADVERIESELYQIAQQRVTLSRRKALLDSEVEQLEVQINEVRNSKTDNSISDDAALRGDL